MPVKPRPNCNADVWIDGTEVKFVCKKCQQTFLFGNTSKLTQTRGLNVNNTNAFLQSKDEIFQNESLCLKEFNKYYQDYSDEGILSIQSQFDFSQIEKKTASVAAFIHPFSLITYS